MAFARDYALNVNKEIGINDTPYGDHKLRKGNNSSFGELGLSKSARKNLLYGAGALAIGTAGYFGGKAAGWWGQPKFSGEAFGPPAPKFTGEAFGPSAPTAIKIPKPKPELTAGPTNTPVKGSGFLPVLKGGVGILGSLFGAKPAMATPSGGTIPAQQASIASPVMGISLLLLGGAGIMLLKKKKSK